MSAIDPVVADRIRKGAAALLAVGGTLLLFRVLGRLAAGRTRGLLVEALLLAAVMAVTLLWVRAAVRVRRRASAPPEAGDGGGGPRAHGHRCEACGRTWACREPACAGAPARTCPTCEGPA